MTIDTAIVLASSGVFDEGAAGRAAVGPLTRVGGMTMLQRTLCAVQRGGIERARILAGGDEPALRALVRRDRRIRMDLRWFSVGEHPPLEGLSWEALTEGIRGACVILGCHGVFPPSLIAALREKGRDGHALVTVGPPGARGWDANPVVRWRVVPHQPDVRVPRVVFAGYDASDPDVAAGGAHGPASAVDLVVAPVRFFISSGAAPAALAAPAAGPIRLALERAAEAGAVRVVSVVAHGYRDIRPPGGTREAEHMLFRDLRRVQGEMDGVVDRWVNRKISGALTRIFLRLRCSPHVITALSLALGLLGAACFAMGSYRQGLAGAVLFQVAVILDCCDGEVARLTFADSRFGQTLDIVADNVVHMAIFAGIAWGAFHEGRWQAGALPLTAGALPLMAAAVAIVANGAALWAVQRVRAVKAAGRWDRLSPALQARFDFLLGRVANRDFSVVVLVCACAGALPWFLWLAAAGAVVFAGAMVWNLRRVPQGDAEGC